jgi:hypothetical protein
LHVYRPEANFSSLEALVTRINHDGEVSKEALGQPELQRFAADGFLQPVGFVQQQQQQQQQQPPQVEQSDAGAAAAAGLDPAEELVAVGASS